MNYRSVAELNRDARQLSHGVPRGVDLVVGIPRSGLLAANLLCLNLDVPITDVEGLCDGRILQTGHRYDGEVSFDDVEKVLVVDDSVDTGREMRETKARLAEEDFDFDVEYAAVYISSKGHQFVDYWADIVDKPRVFEWNVMHHPMLQLACVDIDGILCRDPTREENDGGPRYREFLQTVEPRVIPTETIGWLVTCRLEKYREETEAWLNEHGIQYNNLVMMDHPSKEARQRVGNHVEYKANVYRNTDTKLFIESSPRQAEVICKRSNQPVLCYETNKLMNPGYVDRIQNKSTDYVAKFSEDPVGFLLKASKYVLSESYYTASRAVQTRLRK